MSSGRLHAAQTTGCNVESIPDSYFFSEFSQFNLEHLQYKLLSVLVMLKYANLGSSLSIPILFLTYSSVLDYEKFLLDILLLIDYPYF